MLSLALLPCVIVLVIFVKVSESVCVNNTYWNPLNNACVKCTLSIIKECPWNYPNLYYADPSTYSCVTVCPSTPSLYADDWTQ